MMVVVVVLFDGDGDENGSHQPDKQRAFQRDACTLQHVTDCECIDERLTPLQLHLNHHRASMRISPGTPSVGTVRQGSLQNT